MADADPDLPALRQAARPAAAPAGLCPRCLLGRLDGPGLSDGGDVDATRRPRRARRGVLETLAATRRARSRASCSATPTAATEPPAGPARVARDARAGRPPGAAPALRRDRPRRHGGRAQGPRPRPRPRPGRQGPAASEHRDNPELVRRFVEEAQIGGQLQHPGIVPVYELGTLRRPPAVLHHEAGQGPDPGRAAGRARRTRPTTCRGSWRSSSRSARRWPTPTPAGVIHRDLKPSNVMVGRFGEVQVMDWGLAKVLPRGGAADDAAAGQAERQETVIATARSGSDAGPVAGRLGAGHARLHGPRAGPGRGRPGRRAGRRLRPGLDPLRDPDRPAGLHRPDRRARSTARRRGATWPTPSAGSTPAGPTPSWSPWPSDCLAAEPRGPAARRRRGRRAADGLPGRRAGAAPGRRAGPRRRGGPGRGGRRARPRRPRPGTRRAAGTAADGGRWPRRSSA